VIYLISAIFLRRRSRWACNVSQIIAFLQLLAAAFGITLGVITSIQSHRLLRGDAWIMAGLAFGGLACMRLIVVLNRAYDAITIIGQSGWGFEPVNVQPQEPDRDV
jgi:hypothetical protein